MLLIPEQIYNIMKEIKDIEKNIAIHNQEIKNGNEIVDFEDLGIPVTIHNSSYRIYNELYEKLKRLKNILQTSKIIEERNFDNIDIGTYFYYKWIDEEDIKSAYLVEQVPSSRIDNKFISIESPFGKSVKGAKEGDIIKYKTRDNIPMQTIQIIKISKDKEDYKFKIRERQYKSRKCRAVRREIKELLISNIEKYNYLNSITESQIKLIQIELYKLKHKYISSTDLIEKNRLKRLITYLENKLNCLIINTPNDNSIGLGSVIEFVLNNGYGYCLELIGRAYTTENQCQYVEYISSLGNALYGKKAGDIFTFMGKNNKEYTGKILDVYNKKYEEIDSPKTYKKLNS